MQTLQYTPSIYQQQDSISHRDSPSAEFLFELSATHQKQSIPDSDPVKFQLDNPQTIKPSPSFSAFKTQDFFQQFNNHFVVIFEGEKELDNGQDFGKTGSFGKDSLNPLDLKKQQSQQQQKYLTKLQSCLDVSKHLSHLAESNKSMLKIDISIADSKDILKMKDKQSPIQFQVKKRTVFKRKENIMSNAQQFKITKKKVMNINMLQSYNEREKSYRSMKPVSKGIQIHQKINTQRLTKRDNEYPFKNLKIDAQSESNIFKQTHNIRQSFRSTTLDNWKRKFHNQKKGMQQKTTKRNNIFSLPFSLH